ncbi:Arm DNA-binding domain-containing protein [Methylomonas sp. EFPC3]|uniref:Arm DNA-binding domain-containing protein n=1 Tax=Methylomonas sp. EFPC3 TaxID=3021710 RepID=UPI0024168CE7|nr:Arm DNA-binding domain-containing protein [Methylomonas sp. EFPC3]WFP51239.1 Arm DNA-binding domain-containing protein [Methylomonas sp. EFPC3]
MLVKTNGAKWWRFDYSIKVRRKTISLGVYPSTSLTDARRKTDKPARLWSTAAIPAKFENP